MVQRFPATGAVIGASVCLALAACGGRTSRSGVQQAEGATPAVDAGGETAADAGDGLWCEPFSGCGGDVVGSWSIVSGCYEPDFLQDRCQRYDYYELAEQGTYDFFADGTYASDVTYSIAYQLSRRADCMTQTCSETVQQSQPPAEGQTVTASCSMSSDGCPCDVHSWGREQRQNTYSVTRNELKPVVDAQTNNYIP